MSPLHGTDAALIQRVAGHVVQSASNGTLPRLSWQLELSASERQVLHARWPLQCALWEELEQRGPRANTSAGDADLLGPLHALLMQQRAAIDPALTVLANVLACACFGSHHLWQDLGASGREEVSRLLEVGFPALFASNTQDLRWKRHLFLMLGERLGRQDLRPPKCDDCDNFDACFGSTATAPLKTWPLTPRP